MIFFAENMQQRLQRKKAWRRKINFFTGKRSVIVLHHRQYHHNNGQNNQSRVKNLWNRLFRRLGKVGKRSTTRKPSTFNQTSFSSWQKRGSLSSWHIWLKFYEALLNHVDKGGSITVPWTNQTSEEANPMEWASFREPFKNVLVDFVR